MSYEINAREVDLTFRIRSTGGNASAATVGTFRWGKANSPVFVTSEEQLVEEFGRPMAGVNDANIIGFLSAQNYLLYSDSLYLVRAIGPAAVNAVSGIATPSLYSVDYDDANYSAEVVANFGEAEFFGRYAGELGNSLKVSIADSTGFSGWEYESLFSYAPQAGEFNMVIVDADGAITGDAGTVLEQYELLSGTEGAKKYDGTSAYYVDVLLANSKWVLAGGTAITFTSGVYEDTLSGGASDHANANYATALSALTDENALQFSFLFTGEITDATDVQAAVDVASGREDCVCFYSPDSSVLSGTDSTKLTAVLDWRKTDVNRDTSYGGMDSGWKLVYDKYTDLTYWIPLSSDVAGLHSQTFTQFGAHWAAAGHNRGQIKNVVRLAYNPSSAHRKQLIEAGINPVISIPGEGTFLYGNKTTLSRPSAFADLNVRFLFIVLRKNISRAARNQLFEFNDEVTRSLFRSAVNAYLADVAANRGLQGGEGEGFYVKCDEENNTAQVIDSNGFVGSIFLKPNRVIHNMELNFVNTPSGIEFKEVERAVR